VARGLLGTDRPVEVTVRPVVPAGAVALAVSSTSDPELGPVIRLGEAGRPGEAPRHAVSALAPLRPLTAREMIEHAPAGIGARSAKGPLDLDALVDFLLGLSHVVVEQPWVREVLINPLLISERGVMARDARVVLHDLRADERHLPRPIGLARFRSEPEE
jgi:acetyltransferase